MPASLCRRRWLITLLIAGTGIANTLITAIYERTARSALMKPVGATTRQVMAVFLAEGRGHRRRRGLVGLVVGLLLTRPLTRWPAIGRATIVRPGRFERPGHIVATPLWLLVLAPLFAMGIGIIGRALSRHDARRISTR